MIRLQSLTQTLQTKKKKEFSCELFQLERQTVDIYLALFWSAKKKKVCVEACVSLG